MSDPDPKRFNVLVVGGGHAGAEAAWAAANTLGRPASVALVTLRRDTIGVMSCNPSIGGLAKGQLAREIDALGGLMGLAADATCIHFKMLNTSKGPAVRGPRCQNDKEAYAEVVRQLIESRPEIEIIEAAVEEILTTDGVATGVRVRAGERALDLLAETVVVTTGTFMRGLMHTGESKAEGGRHGEDATSAISASLRGLGFELGRLKTGTPARLRRGSIAWESLPIQAGDAEPQPFSELTPCDWTGAKEPVDSGAFVMDRFPLLEQVECRQTSTSEEAHAVVRDNLHRAPMYSGEIDSVGPRYCPAFEDKVVRFPQRTTHSVFLEPESLRTDWVYCNGISSSLPEDVQDVLVRTMPGCANAEILRYGYAVEYDMVRPHQIRATGETKLVRNLYLAGQINGTSGYEEAGAQGLVAGVNAARRTRGEPDWVLGRHEAYIGVLMDDLVTKTPVEPYRMFTSRAEHRLMLRADNAPDRLTGIAADLGLLGATDLGRRRLAIFERRGDQLAAIRRGVEVAKLAKSVRRTEFTADDLRSALPGVEAPPSVFFTAWADARYEAYLIRERAEIRRRSEMESKKLPRWIEYLEVEGLRAEAAAALDRFRPETFGQAGRLEGVTPADLTLLAVRVSQGRAASAGA
ncbi:MAG: tRNA uridine-5-carboxymethylaminomethyl(34) synthesis enzyme MnmG [Planctomycetota bacterium]